MKSPARVKYGKERFASCKAKRDKISTLPCLPQIIEETSWSEENLASRRSENERLKSKAAASVPTYHNQYERYSLFQISPKTFLGAVPMKW
mmetsp:Transcript_3237/g.5024  ORF Transcript_3237/g.5024 Transcript_3237/m.5024 type:complete len:91 (-) Transcript_3237:117-389(-)|eukprot:CAMPEP_0171451860 /NCGR_PEP_ID=MMETSP0945-20130129/194_1 /TAXON_ID=109269 /ORGANISM="Vaucheria litorea, Strain CCMP2940" /LENGTH=90 /DNA_ID=CAMNT_0011976401 /DNA_START=23 /DNA_END=295 /DNA_ORIENTATION=+